MTFKNIMLATIVIVASYSGNLIAGKTYEVGQKNKHFTIKNLKIKVGDKVKFTNQDKFYHNVFSLSETKSFDLGSYRQGKFKEVTFDKAGKIEVECAIHSRMRMVIEVEK